MKGRRGQTTEELVAQHKRLTAEDLWQNGKHKREVEKVAMSTRQISITVTHDSTRFERALRVSIDQSTLEALLTHVDGKTVEAITHLAGAMYEMGKPSPDQGKLINTQHLVKETSLSHMIMGLGNAARYVAEVVMGELLAFHDEVWESEAAHSRNNFVIARFCPDCGSTHVPGECPR